MSYPKCPILYLYYVCRVVSSSEPKNGQSSDMIQLKFIQEMNHDKDGSAHCFVYIYQI